MLPFVLCALVAMVGQVSGSSGVITATDEKTRSVTMNANGDVIVLKIDPNTQIRPKVSGGMVNGAKGIAGLPIGVYTHATYQGVYSPGRKLPYPAKTITCYAYDIERKADQFTKQITFGTDHTFTLLTLDPGSAIYLSFTFRAMVNDDDEGSFSLIAINQTKNVTLGKDPGVYLKAGDNVMELETPIYFPADEKNKYEGIGAVMDLGKASVAAKSDKLEMKIGRYEKTLKREEVELLRQLVKAVENELAMRKAR